MAYFGVIHNGGSGDQTVSGDLDVTGTVTAADLTATDDLVVADDATIGGDLAVTGATTMSSLTVSGALSADLLNGTSFAQLNLATAGLTATNTGTGTVAAAGEATFGSTGATAGSSARLHTGATPGWSSGKGWGVINWSKRIHWQITWTTSNTTTNGKGRFQVGKNGTAAGDLANRGIGIRADNLALKGLAHNGSALTTVDLLTNLVANTAAVIDIVSDGAGNVTWYVNGSQAGTTSAGPTGDGASGDSRVMFEVENGADAATYSAALHRAFYRFAP